MLSLPDLKEKRILCIPSYEKLENKLKFRNNNIFLYRDNKVENKISTHLVISIFIIGEFTITSQLIRQCLDRGISIFFLTHSFRSYAELMSLAEGNFKLRGIQYNDFNNNEVLLSKMVIKNKIENQRRLLKKQKNEYNKVFYQKTLQELEKARDIKSILGLEGSFSSYYFPYIFSEQNWYRRAPRTKEDIPNFMLDIGYTFMFNFVDSILRLFGFDTYKGFYHRLFFQRKSLACDIMEPFRCLIDKQLIKSYNLGQINEDDFKFKDGSFYFKNPKIQKKYTKIWFNLIMENNEEIYKYILNFYRHILAPDKYLKPEYRLK